MKFEGEEVDGMRVQLRQFKGDIDAPLTVDETVVLTVVAKVTAVQHNIDQKDHRFYRNHLLQIEEVSVA